MGTILLNVKFVILLGNLSIYWLNPFPNVKCLILEGNLSIDWLKLCPNVKC